AAAARHFRRGSGVGGHEPADHRADAAGSLAQPRHVPRRLVPDVHGVPDRDRGVSVGSGPGGARSADPPACRAASMSEFGIPAGPAPPDKGRALSGGIARAEHYVSPAPFDPYSVDAMTPAQERFYRAPPIKLMWWRLRRHRVAV